MKQLLLAGSLLLLLACRKSHVTVTNNPKKNPYAQVKAALRDSLSAVDIARLNWQQVTTYPIPGSDHYLVRVGYIDRPLADEFVLLEMTSDSKLIKGKQVQVDPGVAERDGEIKIASLDRQAEERRPLRKGQPLKRPIDTNHPGSMTYSFPASDAGDYLPEVIVVGYRNAPPTTYYFYLSFIDPGINGGGSGYYGASVSENNSNISGGGGGESGASGSSGGSNTGGGTNPFNADQPLEPFLEVEPEYTDGLPGVDIRKYFNCFDLVPNAGAKYTIKLCSDLPINSKADAAVKLGAGISVGHTFLMITKTNGTQNITQSFGFYPQESLSFLDPFAGVPSSIKDNGGREINASISMSISESQFQIVKQKSIDAAAQVYKLGDYNCTDFALSIFNAVRTSPILSNPYLVTLPTMSGTIVNSITLGMKNAPQSLFSTLQIMKQQNGLEASHIQIDQTHNSFADISHGECN